MRRTKEDAAVTKQSLLRAALAVFSRQGYAATTLDDVAREAGTSRGAIYWHFGGKPELYQALLDAYAARGGQIVQAAAAEGGSLREVLRSIFVRLLEAVEGDPELRAVMELQLFKTERTPELVATQAQQSESTRVLLTGIAAAMRGGIERGELRSDLDPEDLARAFLALQNGLVYLWLLDPRAFALAHSGRALAEILADGLAARPA